MNQVTELMSGTGWVMLAAAMLLLLTLVIWWRVRNLERKYHNFMRGATSKTSLEERLIDLSEENKGLRQQLGDTHRRLIFLEQMAQRCIQRVAVVRYNAFGDMGSDLSFACALLDEVGSGVVLSGLYGRDESRIYAKPVEKTVSSYLLSSEEKAAIDKAMRTGS